MRLTAIQVGAGWFSEHPDGPDRYYLNLIEALPDAGVACRGFVVGTSLVEQETDGSVRTFAEPGDPILKRWKNLRQAVGRCLQGLAAGGSPTVLVSHAAVHAYPLLKSCSGVPLVAHYHGCRVDQSRQGGGFKGWVRRRLEKKVYRQAARVIALSQACSDAVCRDYGVDPARVSVIPVGVDLDRFADAAALPRGEARKQFGWPADRPVVFANRQLENGMGLELLVGAMKRVRQAVPNAVCMVAGRGELAAAFVKMIEAAGLDDAITPLGFVADGDLPMAYRAADVVAVPAEGFEDYGVGAAEALAAGTPVLVTPHNGLPEIVGGLDKKLVVAATAQALGDALAAALSDPSRLPTPEACRLYAAAEFDWPVIARRVAEVYAAAVR